jgi:hypothetical protein
MKRPRPLSIGPYRTRADAVEAAIAGGDRTADLTGIGAHGMMHKDDDRV